MDAAVQNPSLLVVDDDPDIRECLSDFLSSEGYEVQTAANGREALQLLQSAGEQPCLVLLDLMMPGMNGWQVIETLKDRPEFEHLTVVVISASHQAPVTVPVLRKPVDVETLLGFVRTHCGKAESVLAH